MTECLPELEGIQIPRCISAGGKSSSIELHTFSDTCLSGYGACTYLRCVCDDCTVFCNLLEGKLRVAPLKPVTIPSLEIVAAVLAAKLSCAPRREHDIQFDCVYLGTDAVVVLRYIRNASTGYEIFVTIRIELLHTLSSIEQ